MGRIVVVDDEPGILKFIEKALIKNGYYVKTTTRPFEVVDFLKEEHFDIAVVDLKMPDTDGLELLEIIKKDFPGIDVIIMTAHTAIETAVECLKKGADDYLVKPFEIFELLTAVEKTLKTKQLKLQLVSLRQMDKLKNEFVSAISHELKTPLQAISVAVELLAKYEQSVVEKGKTKRCRPVGDIREPVGLIIRHMEKMKGLVDRLLDSAKLEVGFAEIRKENISAAKIIGERDGQVHLGAANCKKGC